MKKLLFLGSLLGFSQLALSQKNITKSVDGICIFYKFSPKMFEFVKTNEWKVNSDQLIDILSYQVSYYVMQPYRGFITNKLFVENYLDTLSYGYNSKNDNRTTTVYYCNCKLLFTDTIYNTKEKLLDERYDKNRHLNKNYNYLYKGKPVRFHTRGLLGAPVDSVMLFP